MQEERLTLEIFFKEEQPKNILSALTKRGKFKLSKEDKETQKLNINSEEDKIGALRITLFKETQL